VGAFAAGGLGVVRGVYATPSPEHVCAIVDGLAYIVDVRAPEHGAAIASQAVVAVFAIRDAPMLVLAGDFDLVGVGPGKVAWSRPRLVVDHLRVLRTSADAIVCTGDIGGDKMGTITLSPQTGEIWESGA
jgi:hypothetical protein